MRKATILAEVISTARQKSADAILDRVHYFSVEHDENYEINGVGDHIEVRIYDKESQRYIFSTESELITAFVTLIFI